MSTEIPTQTAQLLRLVCRALDEKKAGDLRVLHVGEVSSITDYLILATGTSEPHLRALRVELEKVLDASGTRILGMDTGMESGWIVVDAFDLMVHLFTTENRDKYGLENLWKDASDIPVAEVISEGKPKIVKKVVKTGVKTSVKKVAKKAAKPTGKKAASAKAAPKKSVGAKKSAAKGKKKS